MKARALPMLVVLAAASSWGLFWLPLRAFEARGLTGGWATLAVFAAPLLLIAALALARAAGGRPSGAGEPLAGLLVGGAVALYAESVLLTEVARALILFYATPVWGTLLEVTVMGRPLVRARAAALLLGLAGLFVILGGRSGWPVPRNAGDLMALLSGMMWAAGSMRLRLAPARGIFESLFAFFLWGSVVALALALAAPEGAGGPPAGVIAGLLPWIGLAAVGFMIPVMGGLLWGAAHMDPGRLGILLQIEAVVGVASAAVLTDEPFGIVEALGTLLVVGAGVVDVLGGDRPKID